MKFKTEDKDFLKLFGNSTKAIKIKNPSELSRVLVITYDKINAILQRTSPLSEAEAANEQEELEKLVQLKYILEKDRFEGLNRKI